MRISEKHIAKLVSLTRDIYTQMGRSEELGTGIKNVFYYNKIYSNVENNDFVEDDIFTTTIPLKIFKDINDELNEPLSEPINDRQKAILKLIHNDKYITNRLQDKIKVGRETIKRDLKKLRELNIIKRVGPDKGGHWEIIKNN